MRSRAARRRARNEGARHRPAGGGRELCSRLVDHDAVQIEAIIDDYNRETCERLAEGRPMWRASAGTTFETFKQPAVASRGMVVTNHPMGSAAGLEMLSMGGNAIDAAIGAVFALSVVEPMMVGPFGGGYINLRTAAGESVCIDNAAIGGWIDAKWD